MSRKDKKAYRKLDRIEQMRDALTERKRRKENQKKMLEEVVEELKEIEEVKK